MPRFLRQFGLRTLLLGCTLAAIFFGMWQWHMRWAEHQHELATQIADRNGDVRWQTWGPSWIHDTFGSRYFQNIVAIHWEHKQITNDDLQLLREIATLEELYVPGNRQITDEGMQVLEHLPRIRKLAIWNTRLTDETLKRVGKLERLEVLDMHRSKVTENGLKYLRDLSNLRRLELRLELTDEGVEHLAAIPNLKVDSLQCRTLTERGVRIIRDHFPMEMLVLRDPQGDQWAGLLVNHPTLRKLTVIDGVMRDEQLRELLRSNLLEDLVLKRVPVGDVGLVDRTKQDTRLTRLSLIDTDVTTRGIAQNYGSLAEVIEVVWHEQDQITEISLGRSSPRAGVLWVGKFQPGDWAYFRKCRDTEWVTIDSTNLDKRARLYFDDDAARVIAQFPALKYLSIQGVHPWTPAGLLALKEAKQLETLLVCSAGLTDDSLAAIGQLTQLKHLIIAGNAFTSAGMKHLVSLKELQELNINLCYELDDEAGRWIAQLDQLKSITANYTGIGDEGWKHLHGMPHLAEVSVSGDGTSDSARQALKNSLPALGGVPSTKSERKD